MNLNPHPNLTEEVIFGLGWFYLALFLMNTCWTYYSTKSGEHVKLWDIFGGADVPVASFWALYSAFLLMISLAHFTCASSPETFMIYLPDFAKGYFDLLADPVSYFTFSIVLFVVMIWAREWLAKPTVAWTFLNLGVLFVTISMTDFDFRQIVGKPDNVPIVAMLYIVGFFTWLYFSRSVDNDRRIAEGRPLFEQEKNEKILVWPDLVYTELICMVVLTVVLVAWALALPAPLEEPGAAVKTPNPSKAPWYFLGLQEMLVYYDPWLAGVVFPSLIVVGLIAIPYIDFNKKGNGYYTFNERKLSVITFLFGFLPLWIAMIILGTFLRGPNWNTFGIFEYWDVHKLEVLNNVNLSEWFWIDLLGRGLPVADKSTSEIEQFLAPLIREAPGLILIGLYFTALPPLLASTICRDLFNKMGFIRYMVFMMLMLSMAALPIKMVLRWSINLKYLVAIPDWKFNI